MSQGLSELIRHLGRVAVRDGRDQLPDGELLRRFAADRDHAAFETLVWRHGAMVLGVCRRIVGPGGDAEDAFQATFLVLVRHARSVRAGDSLAGWLYRVARRLGTRASRQNVLRTRRECVTARAEAVTNSDAEWADWRATLDREVGRLPRRYREAFVLCHLDGRAHEDAARELGCPLGTLHSRLARAKERLRNRLGALPVVTGVAVPQLLVGATARAAASLLDGSVVTTAARAIALSHGVWSPMALIKAKLLVGAVSALVAIGSGTLLLRPPAASATQPPAAPAEPTIDELRRENERLRREVAYLKRQLSVQEKAVVLGREDDAPSDAEVLRAMPKAAGAPPGFRDKVTIVKEKLVDRLDPPRDFPLIGPARQRHRHWQCTVYYMETEERPGQGRVVTPRVQVVYLDQDTLVRVAETTK